MKKKWLRNLLIVAGVILLLYLAATVVPKIIRNKKQQDRLDGLHKGFSITSPEDNREKWEQTPSDIEGMTVWQKYEMGLSARNGSDTDGDGLTDREELEVYHSDPLKISSAGDLYTDGYKVRHGMDLNIASDYTGEILFPNNACPEIGLKAEVPTDLFASVKRVEHPHVEGLEQVYAEYIISNYFGGFTVDITELLAKTGAEHKDITLYLTDEKELWHAKADWEGNIAAVQDVLDPRVRYHLYIAEDRVFERMKIAVGTDLSAVQPAGSAPDEDRRVRLLVYGSPLLSWITKVPVRLLAEDMGSEEANAQLRKDIEALMSNGGITEGIPYHSEIVSGMHLQATEDMFGTLWHVLRSGEEPSGWEAIPYMFWIVGTTDMKLGYAEELEQKLEGNTETQPEGGNLPGQPGGTELETTFMTDFDLVEDILPFENFKSTYGENGNCSGISHLTAYLYNTGSYPESGRFHTGLYQGLSWSVSAQQDPENATLCNPGLSDYKTPQFVREHLNKQGLLDSGLTPGELEFIKMIGASYHDANVRTNLIYSELYGGNRERITYDYGLIQSMKEHLAKGKILDVHMRMADGSGHAVNIYGYKDDPREPGVTWFYVYDSNLPPNAENETRLSAAGLRLRVERQGRANQAGDTFSYDYFPICSKEYGASSNPSVCENPFLIVMDENWEMLND